MILMALLIVQKSLTASLSVGAQWGPNEDATEEPPQS